VITATILLHIDLYSGVVGLPIWPGLTFSRSGWLTCMLEKLDTEPMSGLLGFLQQGDTISQSIKTVVLIRFGFNADLDQDPAF
jgi:hypothetical protein